MLRKLLKILSPLFRHHLSDGKWYTVIFMAMEEFGDLSAFGSNAGFDMRRAANQAAALSAIRGILQYKQMNKEDFNYFQMKVEKQKKEDALQAIHHLMDERDYIRHDNMILMESIKIMEKKIKFFNQIVGENLELQERLGKAEIELHKLKKKLGSNKTRCKHWEL